MKHFVNFKLSLLPYLYNSAIDAHKLGHPMMRPLFAEFPEDPITWHLDTQYMLGENLLIAPVFNNEGDVQYYVPKGKWYGLLDGKFREGPGYVTEKHDYFSLPVLLRPGSAVVVGASQEVAHYDWAANIKLVVNVTEGMDTTVDIPDYEKVGEIKARLAVKCTASSLRIDVVEGVLVGAWKVAVPGKKLGYSGSEEFPIPEKQISVILDYA